MQLLAVMKSGKIGKFQGSLREDVHKYGQISSPDRVYIQMTYRHTVYMQTYSMSHT